MGAMALGTYFSSAFAKEAPQASLMGRDLPHFPAKAKRVIYLHMAGSPSQLELFDYKPELAKLDGKDCPDSLLEGKTFALFKEPQNVGSTGEFSTVWRIGCLGIRTLASFFAGGRRCMFLKAMHTHEFNHAPAQLMMHSGSPRLGRPSMGSWVTYWLGFGK